MYSRPVTAYTYTTSVHVQQLKPLKQQLDWFHWAATAAKHVRDAFPSRFGEQQFHKFRAA